MECFQNKTFLLWNNGFLPEVYVKLVFRLIPAGHADDTEYTPVTIVQTYLISDKVQSASLAGEFQFNYEYEYTTTQLFPDPDYFGEFDNWEIAVVDENFLGVEDESDLFPDPYLYTAKTFENTTIDSDVFGSSVFIGENTVVNPGVTIHAANDIYISPENNYNTQAGDIAFIIEDVSGTCLTSILAVQSTDVEIENVCNSTSYQNSASARAADDTAELIEYESLLAVPNPAASFVSILIPETVANADHLMLCDTQGRIVAYIKCKQSVDETRSVELNLDGLAPGIYVATLLDANQILGSVRLVRIPEIK
ncbi:MAG: T9SS type A sorting domain-containing protein [Flavobacteriales bacterium]|nr:T9SS type A sorting domain-containing protein [Flavobacteriales bacterium]